MSKKIIIFKNEATGDLIHAREAIFNIINSNKDKEIILYLSYLNKEFTFLFSGENLKFKFTNHNLSILEKAKIFISLIGNPNIEVFILAPKNFYYYLSFFFRKIKFYALTMKDINQYRRPNNFLKKYLYKYIVNDRSINFKRPSIFLLQNQLIGDYYKYDYKIKLEIKKNEIPITLDDYYHFHINKKKFDKLGWGSKNIDIILNHLLKYKQKIIITRDIENNNRDAELYEKYNVYDFNNKNFINNKSNITILENVKGQELYEIIKKADKIIAFHGMITSFAWIEKKKVLDLYFCEINNWNDYRRYRNSFYEFKPTYSGYDFIIPKKDIKKTLKKMDFFLKK